VKRCDFRVLLNSAETLVKWGGKINSHLLAYSFSYIVAKNYQYRTAHSATSVSFGHSVVGLVQQITLGQSLCRGKVANLHAEFRIKIKPLLTYTTQIHQWNHANVTFTQYLFMCSELSHGSHTLCIRPRKIIYSHRISSTTIMDIENKSCLPIWKTTEIELNQVLIFCTHWRSKLINW